MVKHFILYLEMSGEINFFSLFQTQSNEWNVGSIPVRKTAKSTLLSEIYTLISNVTISY